MNLFEITFIVFITWIILLIILLNTLLWLVKSAQLGFVEIHLWFDLFKTCFTKHFFILPHEAVNPGIMKNEVNLRLSYFAYFDNIWFAAICSFILSSAVMFFSTAFLRALCLAFFTLDMTLPRLDGDSLGSSRICRSFSVTYCPISVLVRLSSSISSSSLSSWCRTSKYMLRWA